MNISPVEVSKSLIELLCSDCRTVVLTGAGISAESGVPTFRGKDGLWNKFDPRELATFSAFMANPKLVWEWYLFRRDLINKVEPNPGHFTLAEMGKALNRLRIVTQNVDNLHQRAGSVDVIELHGNIARNKCADCGAPVSEQEIDPDQIPLCQCGGRIRPDVVWFGEMLPFEAIETAQRESSQCELFFSIGTSAEVYPAADLPRIAKRAGAYLVEINPDPTEVTHIADEVFAAPSGEVLPELWRAAMNEQRAKRTDQHID